MAGNPKYGLTYKTSDGKTKTLTGINLGIGGYTSEQISAFVGIVAEVTNKTVTALDVTTANAVPPPEPPKDLIESFTVSPSTLSATIGGDPVTAEITITTSPQDANYQLRIEDAPGWVSIDDTTIIFAPPAGTVPDHYLFTVIAMTKDDEEEFAVTLNVENTRKIPDFQITNTKGNENFDWNTIYYYSSTDKQTYPALRATFSGQKRKVFFTGQIPKGLNGSITASGIATLNESQRETSFKFDVRFHQRYYEAGYSKLTGSQSYEWTFTLEGNAEYKEVTKTITITNAPNKILKTYDNAIVLKE